MKSHLTRRVFRRLLLSQPVLPHRNFHHPPRLRTIPQNGRRRPSVVQVRTFFGLFQQPQRDIREPLLDPGMEKMLELDKRIHLIARLPPPEDLSRAFKIFIQAKRDRNQIIEDFHATQLLQTLNAIEEATVDGQQRWLSPDELQLALRVLADQSSEFTKIHNALARALFAAIRRHGDLEKMDPDGKQKLLARYVKILCESGDTEDARHALEQLAVPAELNKFGIWTLILRGFAKENNEVELLKTVKSMEQRNLELTPLGRRTITLFYAQKNNVQATKKWLRSSIFDQTNELEDIDQSQDEAFRILLEFCLRNHEMEWGQSVLMTGGDKSSEEQTWDAIFRAAAATGKNVDEVNHMMKVMVRRAKEEGKRDVKPDIDTFNGLISFALSRNDTYSAERYFMLAERWGVAPNARSYILQVEYRLAAGDIAGAQASYSRLRNEPIANNEDWRTMNHLLRVLVTQPNPDDEAVHSLIDDISERRRTFPSDTIITLCDYHLARDEYFEVVDLLQTYAYQFSTAARIRIRDRLVAYTLHPTTDTGSAWDTYMIFHQIFDLETRRDIRNRVMTLMFDRGRPDLASHVFTRMSTHPRADTRPDVETYVLAFEGIAKTQETEALEVIHNLLKLDTETEPCTRLYNALMLAYASCDIPWRALEFWDQIATSDEGPSYESLHIAFRACERAPFGYRRAKKIWSQLKQTDAEITRELFASYVGALAGQHLFDDLVEEVKNMALTVVGGEGPDEFT